MKFRHYLLIALACCPSFTQAEEMGLYTDAQIKAVYEKFVKRPKDGLLRIVPNGETKPIAEILKSLGIDPKRLGRPSIKQLNMVDFHVWQLSEGFKLSIMVANNDPENAGKPILGLKGYGVRLSRAELPAGDAAKPQSKKMGDFTYIHLAWFNDQDVVGELLKRLEDRDIRAVQETQTGVTSVWVVSDQEADGLSVLHANPQWMAARIKGVSGYRATAIQESKKQNKAEMATPRKLSD